MLEKSELNSLLMFLPCSGISRARKAAPGCGSMAGYCSPTTRPKADAGAGSDGGPSTWAACCTLPPRQCSILRRLNAPDDGHCRPQSALLHSSVSAPRTMPAIHFGARALVISHSSFSHTKKGCDVRVLLVALSSADIRALLPHVI